MKIEKTKVKIEIRLNKKTMKKDKITERIIRIKIIKNKQRRKTLKKRKTIEYESRNLEFKTIINSRKKINKYYYIFVYMIIFIYYLLLFILIILLTIFFF